MGVWVCMWCVHDVCWCVCVAGDIVTFEGAVVVVTGSYIEFSASFSLEAAVNCKS